MKQLFVIILNILAGLLRAYVALALWGWFVLPLGAPPITFWHSYGLMLVVTLAHSPGAADALTVKDSNAEETTNLHMQQVFAHLFLSFLVWGAGCLVNWIMR